jgi:hypothetical protein
MLGTVSCCTTYHIITAAPQDQVTAVWTNQERPASSRAM